MSEEPKVFQVKHSTYRRTNYDIHTAMDSVKELVRRLGGDPSLLALTEHVRSCLTTANARQALADPSVDPRSLGNSGKNYLTEAELKRIGTFWDDLPEEMKPESMRKKEG